MNPSRFKAGLAAAAVATVAAFVPTAASAASHATVHSAASSITMNVAGLGRLRLVTSGSDTGKLHAQSGGCASILADNALEAVREESCVHAWRWSYRAIAQGFVLRLKDNSARAIGVYSKSGHYVAALLSSSKCYAQLFEAGAEGGHQMAAFACVPGNPLLTNASSMGGQLTAQPRNGTDSQLFTLPGSTPPGAAAA